MKKILLGISIAIVLIFVGAFFYYDHEIHRVREFNKIIEIKQGVPLKVSLKPLGINENLAFKYYLRKKNQGKDIKAGYYEIRGKYNIIELIDILEEGKQKLYKLTIPEGYSLDQIIQVLTKDGKGTKESVTKALSEIDWFPYPTPNGNFEGYLYPETYFYADNASEKIIIEKMLKQFLKKFPADKYPDKEEFYKKLIMASIIEREAKLSQEKPLMASVFYNRMKKGMTLSSDATVNYVYNYQKKRMYYKDLEIDSPYNTYKYKGLPPSPISNPDSKSIDAAFNPADTEYLFFVAVGDGSHYFSKTYREHLDIQKQNRKK